MSSLGCLSALLLVAVLAPPGLAEIQTSVAEGDWLNPFVWSPSVPGADDAAQLDTPIYLDDGEAVVRDVRFMGSSGGPLLSVFGGRLTVVSEVIISAATPESSAELIGGTIETRDLRIGFFGNVGTFVVKGGQLEVNDDIRLENGALSVRGGNGAVSVGDNVVVTGDGVLEFRPTSHGVDGLSPIVCNRILFGSGTGPGTVRMNFDDVVACPGDTWVIAETALGFSGTPTLEANTGAEIELITSGDQLLARVVVPTAGPAQTTYTVEGAWFDSGNWTNGLPSSVSNATMARDLSLADGCAFVRDLYLEGSSVGTTVFEVSGGALTGDRIDVGVAGSTSACVLAGGLITVAEANVGRASNGQLDVKNGVLHVTTDLIVGRTLLAEQSNDNGRLVIHGGQGEVTVDGKLHIGRVSELELRPTSADSTGLTPITCADIEFASGDVLGGSPSTAVLRLDSTDYMPCVGDSWVIANYSGTLTGTPILEGPGLLLDTSTPGQLILRVVDAVPGSAPTTTTTGDGSWFDASLWTDNVPNANSDARVFDDIKIDGGCAFADGMLITDMLTFSGGTLEVGNPLIESGGTLILDGGAFSSSGGLTAGFNGGRVDIRGGTVELNGESQIGFSGAGTGILSVQGNGGVLDFAELNFGEDAVLELRPTSAGPDGLSVISCTNINFPDQQFTPATILLDGTDHAPCVGDSWVVAQYSGTVFGTPDVAAPGFDLELDLSVPGQLSVRVVEGAFISKETQTSAAGSWHDASIWDDGVPTSQSFSRVYHDVVLASGCGVGSQVQAGAPTLSTLTIAGGLLDVSELCIGGAGVIDGHVILESGAIKVGADLEIAAANSGMLRVTGGTLTGQNDLQVGSLFAVTGDVGTFAVHGGESTINFGRDMEVRKVAVFEVRPTGPGAEGLTAVSCRDLTFLTGGVLGGGTSTATLRIDTTDYTPCTGDSWVIVNYSGDLSGTPVIESTDDNVGFQLDTSVPGELRIVATQLPLPGVTWIELDGALSGSTTPALSGNGVLEPGCPASIEVTSAPANAPAVMVVSLSRIDVPFKGGTLVPAPDYLLDMTTNGGGNLSLSFIWPEEVPSGLSMFLQTWIPDVGGPANFAATNALEIITP